MNAGCFTVLHRSNSIYRVALMLCMLALAACEKGQQTGEPKAGPVAASVAGGNSEQGKKLLAQYQCGACHEIPGVAAARGATGPSLEAFSRRSYIAGHIPNYPDPLIQWIVNPPAMAPGTLMPSMGVSTDDARHMAAYLYTLR
jgi:cytochrome c